MLATFDAISAGTAQRKQQTTLRTNRVIAAALPQLYPVVATQNRSVSMIEHMKSFTCAQHVTALMDWLFAQKKD